MISSLILALPLLIPMPRWETHGPPYPIDAVAVAADGTIYAAARYVSQDASWLYRSNDNHGEWMRIATAPGGERVRQLATDPTSSARLLAATRSETGVSLYRTDDSGSSWSFELADNYPGDSFRIFFDPTRPDTAFYVGSSLQRSRGSGPWEFISRHDYNGFPAYTTSSWVAPDGTLYWINSGCTLQWVGGRCVHWVQYTYVSSNAGETSEVLGAPYCLYLRTIAFADPRVAYASEPGCSDLLRSEDAGLSWEPYDPSGGLASVLSGRTITQLLIDPRNPTTIYALATAEGDESAGEILWSRDSGQTWSVFPGPGGVGVTAVALDTSGAMVVGTTNGVFVESRQTRMLPTRE